MTVCVEGVGAGSQVRPQSWPHDCVCKGVLLHPRTLPLLSPASPVCRVLCCAATLPPPRPRPWGVPCSPPANNLRFSRSHALLWLPRGLDLLASRGKARGRSRGRGRARDRGRGKARGRGRSRCWQVILSRARARARGSHRGQGVGGARDAEGAAVRGSCEGRVLRRLFVVIHCSVAVYIII